MYVCHVSVLFSFLSEALNTASTPELTYQNLEGGKSCLVWVSGKPE